MENQNLLKEINYESLTTILDEILKNKIDSKYKCAEFFNNCWDNKESKIIGTISLAFYKEFSTNELFYETHDYDILNDINFEIDIPNNVSSNDFEKNIINQISDIIKKYLKKGQYRQTLLDLDGVVLDGENSNFEIVYQNLKFKEEKNTLESTYFQCLETFKDCDIKYNKAFNILSLKKDNIEMYFSDIFPNIVLDNGKIQYEENFKICSTEVYDNCTANIDEKFYESKIFSSNKNIIKFINQNLQKENRKPNKANNMFYVFIILLNLILLFIPFVNILMMIVIPIELIVYLHINHYKKLRITTLKNAANSKFLESINYDSFSNELDKRLENFQCDNYLMFNFIFPYSFDKTLFSIDMVTSNSLEGVRNKCQHFPLDSSKFGLSNLYKNINYLINYCINDNALSNLEELNIEKINQIEQKVINQFDELILKYIENGKYNNKLKKCKLIVDCKYEGWNTKLKEIYKK